LGGPEVAAALAGEPTGETVLSLHRGRDEEGDPPPPAGRRGRGGQGQGGRCSPPGRLLRVLRPPRRPCLGGHPPPALPARNRRAARGPLDRPSGGAPATGLGGAGGGGGPPD